MFVRFHASHLVLFRSCGYRVLCYLALGVQDISHDQLIPIPVRPMSLCAFPHSSMPTFVIFFFSLLG